MFLRMGIQTIVGICGAMLFLFGVWLARLGSDLNPHNLIFLQDVRFGIVAIGDVGDRWIFVPYRPRSSTIEINKTSAKLVGVLLAAAGLIAGVGSVMLASKLGLPQERQRKSSRRRPRVSYISLTPLR